MEWEPAQEFRHDHYRAKTPFGEYLIGPRRTDGAWEYCTPEDSWGMHENHMLDNLTQEQAFAAVETDFYARLKGVTKI